MSRCVGICLVVGFFFALPAEPGQLSSSAIGFVVDATTGLPIQGAVVRVVAAGQASSGPNAAILASATTEPDGTFLLSMDVKGVLEVAAQGYAVKRSLWPSAGTREIRLERGARIRIRVTDEAASSVPRAVITIRTVHPGNVVSDALRTNTGVGEFVDLPSGPTTIVVRAEGFAPVAVAVQVAPGGQYDPIVVTLSRAASIRGVVLDSSGQRRSEATIVANYGAEVPLRTELRNFISRREASEDLDFELRNLVPRTPVQVYAQYDGRRSEVQTVVLNPGEQRSDIVLIVN
jgi:hypothetical protein